MTCYEVPAILLKEAILLNLLFNADMHGEGSFHVILGAGHPRDRRQRGHPCAHAYMHGEGSFHEILKAALGAYAACLSCLGLDVLAVDKDVVDRVAVEGHINRLAFCGHHLDACRLHNRVQVMNEPLAMGRSTKCRGRACCEGKGAGTQSIIGGLIRPVTDLDGLLDGRCLRGRDLGAIGRLRAVGGAIDGDALRHPLDRLQQAHSTVSVPGSQEEPGQPGASCMV